MMWKVLSVRTGIVLGLSVGSLSVFAAQEGDTRQEQLKDELDLNSTSTECKNDAESVDVFDPVNVEERIFVSAKGHKVRFWLDGKDQWRADVIENFTNIEYEGVSVGFGNNWSIEKLARQITLENRLHVFLRDDVPGDFDEEGVVYIGEQGLLGGCSNCGQDDCQDDEKCIHENEGLLAENQQQAQRNPVQQMQEQFLQVRNQDHQRFLKQLRQQTADYEQRLAQQEQNHQQALDLSQRQNRRLKITLGAAALGAAGGAAAGAAIGYGIVKGAAAGTAIGSTAGPPGMIAGAAIGAVVGGVVVSSCAYAAAR
ncbi:MAG: hypothetical protein AAF320_06970 [Myxococcota bacterium]